MSTPDAGGSLLVHAERTWGVNWSRAKKHVTGWLFVLPWVVGFLILMLFPFIASFLLSFARYELVSSPEFVGMRNFVHTFAEDPKFWISLRVTFSYALMTIPPGTVMAVLVAVLLNQKVFGVTLFRTAFYVPAAVSGVGLALLWTFILDRNGPINWGLGLIGIKGPNWLWDIRWALPSLALMSLFSVGGSMVIILAALQGIPQEQYEAVEIDGGGELAKFWNVTIPQISPAIFYNVTMSLIGVLQTFQEAYIMTQGGPGNATLFYGLHLFRNAFMYYRMGYACTLAWVMFLVILTITGFNFLGGKYWVFYEAERPR